MDTTTTTTTKDDSSSSFSANADATTTTTTTTTTTQMIWQSLVAWIRQQGGEIHPFLTLVQSSHAGGGRGVVCTRRIVAGETLMRVPATAVLSGRHLPSEYYYYNNNFHHHHHFNNNHHHNKRVGESSSTNDGQDGHRNDNNGKGRQLRKVSPWLRCLAAYYQAQQQQQQQASSCDAMSSTAATATATTTTTTNTTTTNFAPYLASLPTSYETVAAWSDEQVKNYLAGTCTQGGSAVAWHATKDELQTRFQRQVRPYLQSLSILNAASASAGNENDTVSDTELHTFQTAMACLSTRAFHLLKENADNNSNDAQKPAAAATYTNNNNNNDDDYTGPFLLPAIDLLNHASTDEPGRAVVTTLHRTADDAFVCKAETDILPNQEILHSYGDSLTSSQYLQTFGFVPASRMERMATFGTTKDASLQSITTTTTTTTTSLPPLSPALLQKQKVLETCWQVIESDLPTRLAARMQDMEDEVWTVQVDRTRTADFISMDLIVDATAAHTLLTDEIVTAATVAFLPSCAYREAAQALLGAEILDDFFLGHLVCTSLLRVIQAKMETYTPISWQGKVYQDDAVLLQQCLQESNNSNHHVNVDQLRLQYGLTIRLEEKACLQALRKSVVEILAKLQASVNENPDAAPKDEDDDDDDDDDDMGQVAKKQKITE